MDAEHQAEQRNKLLAGPKSQVKKHLGLYSLLFRGVPCQFDPLPSTDNLTLWELQEDPWCCQHVSISYKLGAKIDIALNIEQTSYLIKI